jgi:PIN domain nuclease of toxin-antitoxin system
VIQDAFEADELIVSAISFWEVAMLVEKGRIEMRRSAIAWRRALLAAGLGEHPVDGEIGARAASMEDLHGDPADRIIAATAVALGGTLITADERLLAWRNPLRRQDARK